MAKYFLKTSRTPSTLVVWKTDILAGFQAPPVRRAADGFIHMMAEVRKSSHLQTALLTMVVVVVVVVVMLLLPLVLVVVR